MNLHAPAIERVPTLAWTPDVPSCILAWEMEEGLGFKFWAGFAGVVIVGGIVGFILLLIFFRAAYAWGLFGALMALGLVLLLVAWIYDRRQVKRFEAEAD
jgi:hypothetical protein